MQLDLEGGAFVVTGASKGIGAATSLALSAEGASVLLVARGADALADAASRCPGEADALALDVTATDAPDRIVGRCVEQFGRIDGLVNNAGAARACDPQDLEDEDWRAQLDLNVMAPMRLIRASAPRMAEAGWGRIVNVCSTASRQPALRNAAYSVAKAGLLSLSSVAAKEWAPHGVLVNAVTPGVVETAMWVSPGGIADEVAEAEGKSREQVLEEAHAEAPTGRLSTMEEVANVIAFLCSERAGNIAGAAWAIDGGAVPTMY